MKTLKVIFAFSLILFIASCGENKSEKTTEETTTENNEAAQEAPVKDTAFLTIEGDDQMKFDKSVLNAKPGQVVQLTLKHVGKLPKNAMGHNWVLLHEGTDIANFSQEAIKANDHDYIPQDDANIIAHTKLLAGGESDTITFTAPKEEGHYPFICSFPGHSGTMKGEFIVE